MSYFTKTQLAQLTETGKPENQGLDHIPVARFFLNGTGSTLLITEVRSTKPLIVSGLCDLSSEFSQIKTFDFEKMVEIIGKNGCELKHDDKFQGKYTISAYQKFAKRRRTVSDLQNWLGGSSD